MQEETIERIISPDSCNWPMLPPATADGPSTDPINITCDKVHRPQLTDVCFIEGIILSEYNIHFVESNSEDSRSAIQCKYICYSSIPVQFLISSFGRSALCSCSWSGVCPGVKCARLSTRCALVRLSHKSIYRRFLKMSRVTDARFWIPCCHVTACIDAGSSLVN